MRCAIWLALATIPWPSRRASAIRSWNCCSVRSASRCTCSARSTLSRMRAARASSIWVTRGKRNFESRKKRTRKLMSWAISPLRLMPSCSTSSFLDDELDDQGDDEGVDRARLAERQGEDQVATDGRLGLRGAGERLHRPGGHDTDADTRSDRAEPDRERGGEKTYSCVSH